MEKFRKIWDSDKNAWLVAHKDMKRKERYRFFLAEFPEASDVTETAFYNQCSRVGAVNSSARHGSRKPRPLYSEQVKKGYVRIKIAQPNVWVSKAKWVYMETHPWEDFTERSNYVFLDGDNRNFAPNNIERVPLSIMALFNFMGGCEVGNPEATKLRILLAKMKKSMFDCGEKLGLVTNVGSTSFRAFREERNRKARIYNATPEHRRKNRERQKAYTDRLKREQPEKWAARKERINDYQKEWARKKREKEHD